MLKGLAVAVAVLLLAGCGSSGGSSAGRTSTPITSPTASPPSAPELSAACRAGVREFSDRYRAVARRADAGTLSLDVLQREATQIYAVASDQLADACPAAVNRVVTAADHQLSLVVADLTICSMKRAMCAQSRSQGTRSLGLALRSAAQVRLLVGSS